MSEDFNLIVTTDNRNQTAEFQLLDMHGVQLEYKRSNFNSISQGHQRGLFDLRNFLRYFVADEKHSDALIEIGVCIACEVLGLAIFNRLWLPQSQRTLRIQLPAASDKGNQLTAAIARVPWEIGRPNASETSLGERNLVTRIVHDMPPSESRPLGLDEDGTLRVLIVFAAAQGSPPLGARLERLSLLRLFEREVLPSRRVTVHVLAHGVTRTSLEFQIREVGGYHVVHWSGHGHLDLLELATADGQADHISGDDLLKLFVDAGGFLPQLVFLGACNSGDILRLEDWNDFLNVATGKELECRAVKAGSLAESAGFTGTAHALLRGGVPSVVGMRYSVGDDYARELAVEFYRALLGHSKPKSVAVALTLARASLLDPRKYNSACFTSCDHATPLLYGEEPHGLRVTAGRSAQLDQRRRRLNTVDEMEMVNQLHFVGRTWELAKLGAKLVRATDRADAKEIALITGLGGMGKTSLAAEAVALWESRFEWILIFQSKGVPLNFEATLRNIDIRLRGQLRVYHHHIKEYPADAIYRDPDENFTGQRRIDSLINNLLRAMQAEPILLVFDNFETNLRNLGDRLEAECVDPAWERLLSLAATALRGHSSRVLVTSRIPIAALNSDRACLINLGPLPPLEAALFLTAHPALRAMMLSEEGAERALAMRLLHASRFHPLLMDRLARLAQTVVLRPQLLQALSTLEVSENFAQLPELFAVRHDDGIEIKYLHDALITSLDILIAESSQDARRLLWVIALASESVPAALLTSVWLRKEEIQQQRAIWDVKQDLESLKDDPEGLKRRLATIPPEMADALGSADPPISDQPDAAPLLRQLIAFGLATEVTDYSDHRRVSITCDELVRERIYVWMARRLNDRGNLSAKSTLMAFANRLTEAFAQLQHKDMDAALECGTRAVAFFARAEAWPQLAKFAGALITCMRDQHKLQQIMPYLRAAVDAVSSKSTRWSCLASLADALRLAAQPDESLPLYEAAAALVRSASVSAADSSPEAWHCLYWIVGNWANALAMVGQLEAARELFLESASAATRGGMPLVHAKARELETLRIDIMTGKSTAALPKINTVIEQIAGWWDRHKNGLPVPDAPDLETIGRAYVSALDISHSALVSAGRFQEAVTRLETSLQLKKELQRPTKDIAFTKLARATLLGRMQIFNEARSETEQCLAIFDDDLSLKAQCLASLAHIFAELGDINQAVVQARRALSFLDMLPNPNHRSVAHGNLATYLKRLGNAAMSREAQLHQLAALVYSKLCNFARELDVLRINYKQDWIGAASMHSNLATPTIATLMSEPGFNSLKQWVAKSEISLAALQQCVDVFILESQ